MLQCLSLKTVSPPSAATSPQTFDLNHCPPQSLGCTPSDATPRSSSAATTPNLTREYTLAVQSDSYTEMWSRIHRAPDPELHEEEPQDHSLHQLEHILYPSRQHVQEALRHARRNNLTRIVSTYFDNTESATSLCLLLRRCVFDARTLYNPLHGLISVLPLHDDSLFTQFQCDSAYHALSNFDQLGNPFPDPDSHNFHDMRSCFSSLRQQLDENVQKSRSRARLTRRAIAGSVLCLIGCIAAVIVTAVAVSTHTLIAFVATPVSLCSCFPGSKHADKESAHMKQLDAAARGTCVLKEDLDTIDRLVGLLYAAVEGDKQLVQIGLERGPEKYLVLEVLKELQRKQAKFVDNLNELEERIILCFNAVNRARALLLQEVHLYQTSFTSYSHSPSPSLGPPP